MALRIATHSATVAANPVIKQNYSKPIACTYVCVYVLCDLAKTIFCALPCRSSINFHCTFEQRSASSRDSVSSMASDMARILATTTAAVAKRETTTTTLLC
ncbi:unnamed protein product [Ceratitis capitata]|uniref:(Mediterranean fruit fly) hypothetical protein n=1 Tax=Ceratitis capitata TaxID=7213 RepID=A0A811UKQ9_CERCA|nr:unnamed protein product [Ceratitis capitata]